MCKYFLFFFSEINIFKTDTLPCPESETDKDIARQRRQTDRQTERDTETDRRNRGGPRDQDRQIIS